MGRPKLLVIRVCELCGTDISNKKTGGKYYPYWRINQVINGKKYGVLCGKCHSRLYIKEYYRKHGRGDRRHEWETARGKRLKFKGKLVSFKYDIRCGVCNYCRAVVPFDCNYTNLHHDDYRYDENNPLRYTIELCQRCHNNEDYRLGRIRRGLDYRDALGRFVTIKGPLKSL